ncbi:hypothetical protein EMCG_03830 [[Emmonsia] crescens]|uniref:Telomeric single stranded DNA binding POT1/Cdc13 domain-containing protein n=1 Tax=[Emmonsia] crescens TaxID=73230 RepID=A0A0G2HV51_9EURO|nr:hypothetical protein EMCG_03830 [Emmonsia crescens UAMH 3008]
MEPSTPTYGASALASTTPTPLAQLSPSLDDLKERHIRAVVILLWPYSSYTKKFSLLFSEPDFRLRDRRGQVRVNFQGASAEAVAKSQVGIGDTVVLSLDGARWQNHDSEIGTPGKGIDWDLTFSSRLLLEVYRDSELFTTVKVEAPPEEQPCIDGIIPATPNRSFSTPQAQTNGEPVNPLATDNWSSPAFSQKFSASFGSHSNLAFNTHEEEDGYIWGKGRKRTKFSRPSSEWVFVDTLPSPPPAVMDAWEYGDLELEEDQQDVTMEEHPSQGDTVPNSQATPPVNDGAQEDEATRISESPKLLQQTESMDSRNPPAGPNISGSFNTTFSHSQTEGSTATFTQNASWDTAHSQQPTITPFSSFGNSFEHEQPLVNHGPAPTRLSPALSPGALIGSSLETPFADTNHNLPPFCSPPSNQLHVYTTAPQPTTPKRGVELTVDETGYKVGSKDQSMVNGPEDVHYMPGHRANSIERPSSPTPVVDFDGQKQFDHEITETDHVVPVTSVYSVDKREGYITELHKAERQAALTMPQDLSGQGADQEMIDEEDEGEEEIEQYIGGTVGEPLEEELEEHVDEKYAELFEEKISRRPTEDLEEELVELEEEMEERMEEELAEEEREEGMEIYSDDEMGRTSSEGSSQLESEEEYDEGSELESEEDAFPPRPTYLAVPRAPPEIIVLDSDDEDEGGPVIPSAPQHVEVLSSDVPPAPDDIEKTNLSHQDFTPVGLVSHVGLGEDSRLEAADIETEPSLLMRNIASASLEPASRLNETSQREEMGYMAEVALHTETEPVAVDGEGEDAASHKSEDQSIYRHASPSFSSGSMSDREPETKHDWPNEVAIDPQLYHPGKRRSPKTDSETGYSVDHGLSHDGAVDVDSWQKPRTFLSPDSKGPLATPIEKRQSTDIPSSPPSVEALSMEDELVTTQLFRDMEEQARRQNLQEPDPVNEMPLPTPHPPEEEEPRTPEDSSVTHTAKDGIDLQNGKAAEHADAIESSSIFQPNINAIGLRSRLSYFFPLSTLADNFNKMTDTISVVISCSKISQSHKGPREYYTTLHLTDLSMSGITVCAQFFRRTKSSLPIAERGDIILLRDFKVQSMDHKMMLLSMAASAWAVFRGGSDTNVQMNGSPVEFGQEEQEYVATLRQWYQEEGEQLAEKHEYLTVARGNTETSSSISSATSSSPSRGKGGIFKKYTRPKKLRHRRITIHELRDGRRYAEVGSPADKDMIHELRDGTVYANL